jgi:hypothetical protein
VDDDAAEAYRIGLAPCTSLPLHIFVTAAALPTLKSKEKRINKFQKEKKKLKHTHPSSPPAQDQYAKDYNLHSTDTPRQSQAP